MDFLQNIFGHDEAQGHYENVYHQPHEAKFSHELLSGAAGFAAMHEYEEHLRKQGQPVTHEKMKELLAGFAAAEVDRLAETKGRDWWDEHELKKAREHARHQAYALADQRYGQGNTGYEFANTQQSVDAYANYRGAPYGAYAGGAPGYGGMPAGYPPPPGAGYGGGYAPAYPGGYQQGGYQQGGYQQGGYGGGYGGGYQGGY